MVTYQQLKSARPSTVDSLAKEWEGTAADYRDAFRQLDDNVTTALNNGYYKGRAIYAASDRSGDLGGHVDAGMEEAKAIKRLVAELGEEAGSIRDSLLNAEKEVGDCPDLRIDAEGKVHVAVQFSGTVTVTSFSQALLLAGGMDPPFTDADWQRIRTAESEAEAYNARIRKLVNRATELDTEIAFKLRAVAETDAKGDVSFNSEPDASVAYELLKKSEDGLSPKEQAELNRLLKANHDDPEFARKLMNELGPDGFARHSANVALTDGLADESIDTFQRYLGETLATATRSDEELASEWAEWIVEHNDEDGVTVTDPDGGHELKVPLDFALSPMLEHGEYAPEFLVPVAENFMLRNEVSSLPHPDVARPDDIAPKYGNPFNSALLALGHSPEAATDFFSRELPIDTPAGRRDGDGTYLEYLLDSNQVRSEEHAFSADRLGAAVEAATTGLPFDAPDGTPRVEHTEQMTAVTRDLIDYVTDNPDEFKDGRLVDTVDSLGDITVNYAEDFYRANLNPAYLDGADAPWVPDSHGDPLGLDPLKAEDAKNAQTDTWMHVLGHDQGAIDDATGALLGVADRAGVEASLGTDQSASQQVEDAWEGYSRSVGELTEGRNEAVENERLRDYDDNALVRGKDAVNYAVSKTVGQIPIAGDLAKDGIDYLANKAVDWAYGSSEADLRDEIEKMKDGNIDDSVSEAGKEVNRRIDTMLANMDLDDPAQTKEAILNRLAMSLSGAAGRG